MATNGFGFMLAIKVDAVDAAFPKEYAALCEVELSDAEFAACIETLYQRIQQSNQGGN